MSNFGNNNMKVAYFQEVCDLIKGTAANLKKETDNLVEIGKAVKYQKVDPIVNGMTSGMEAYCGSMNNAINALRGQCESYLNSGVLEADIKAKFKKIVDELVSVTYEAEKLQSVSGESVYDAAVDGEKIQSCIQQIGTIRANAVNELFALTSKNSYDDTREVNAIVGKQFESACNDFVQKMNGIIQYTDELGIDIKKVTENVLNAGASYQNIAQTRATSYAEAQSIDA